MGEGVTRVVATDRKGTRVRTLSQEIARMRIRLTAVLTELDRRRHNATDVKHLARAHAGAVAAGALVLAAIVATPVLKVRRRRQRRWAHQGVTLTALVLTTAGEPDGRQSETTWNWRERPDRRPESADAATKTRRLAERRAFVESRLTNSSVPLQRVAGPRSFTVSPVRTFAPFSSL
jgi:hypothetical protein